MGLKHIQTFKSYMPPAVGTSSNYSNSTCSARPGRFGRPRLSGRELNDRSSQSFGEELPLPPSMVVDVDDVDGEKVGPPPTISLEGLSNQLSRRVGTILIVELWYKDLPFSALDVDVNSQHSISEAFLQLVHESLTRTRGTPATLEMGRVVASWNTYTPQVCRVFPCPHSIWHTIYFLNEYLRVALLPGCVTICAAVAGRHLYLHVEVPRDTDWACS